MGGWDKPSPFFGATNDSLGFPQAQAYYSGFTGGVIPSEAHSGSLGDFLSAGKGPLVVTKKIETMNITYSKVANWYMFLDFFWFILCWDCCTWIILSPQVCWRKNSRTPQKRWWQRCHGFWLDIPVNQSIDWKYRESVGHVETCRHSFPHKQKPQIKSVISVLNLVRSCWMLWGMSLAHAPNWWCSLRQDMGVSENRVLHIPMDYIHSFSPLK